MLNIIQYFINLCLLKARPDQLPAIPLFMLMVALVNLLIGTLLATSTIKGVDMALLSTLLDICLLMVFTWTLLWFKSHPLRFVQTMTALLGSGAILALIAMPLQFTAVSAGAKPDSLAALALGILVFLIIWSMLVTAQILRYALDVGMGLAVALSFTYITSSSILLKYLFSDSLQ